MEMVACRARTRDALVAVMVLVLSICVESSRALPMVEVNALRDIYHKTGGPAWVGEVAQN